MRENPAIRSGFTSEYISRLPQWVQAEQNSPFYNWDALIAQQETGDLLRRIRAVPFYRYMARYLVQRHPVECDALAESLGLSSVDALLAAIFEEIEAAPKRKPIQKALAAMVMDDFTANGCGAGEGYVQGSLLDDSVRYDVLALREVLFGSTITDEKFFLLAIGMHMPYEDVELFLQKVLLRTGLDLWQPLETMLYLCIRHGSGCKLELLRCLMAAYKAVKPGAAAVVSGTSSLHTLAQEAVAQVTREHYVFDAITPGIIRFLEDYASIINTQESYRRSSNRTFLELTEDFMALTKQDRAIFTESMREPITPYATGTVRIATTDSAITVPKGTVFTAEGKKEGMQGVDTCLLEVTETAAFPAERPSQSVVLPVKCTTPVTAKGGDFPGKTEFRADLPQLQSAQISNYSKFKAAGKQYPDGKCYLTGKLTVVCDAGTAIPKGTLFFARGLYFESLGAVEGGMFLEIPVKCKQEGFYIPKNCVLSVEDFPGKETITAMENDTINLPRRNYLTEGELCSYLYHPADKPNYWVSPEDEVLTPEEYASLLHPILNGARLTPTRLTVLHQQSRERATRKELLTAAFLRYAAQCQLGSNDAEFDALTQLTGMLQSVNEVLRSAGYHELYLPNPYDCLLSYLATCEEPLYAFKNIWGIYRGFYHTDKEDQ